MIRPRGWVESSFVWPSVVAGIDDPALLVRLSLERDNLLLRCPWRSSSGRPYLSEHAKGVAPEAPSRLNCVFVALDVYGASKRAGTGQSALSTGIAMP